MFSCSGLFVTVQGAQFLLVIAKAQR